ncbi:MAG: hypothetical protein K9N21_16435 [Deltaproteobacteria bacterium]|nr:hypothetical protein [Deltaproteobacteria bacterium]
MSKILIVESYPHLASLYREVLFEDGHQVFVASSCREAENIARDNDIELAMIDESLPAKCEEELLKAIKSIQPHIKAIVCPLNKLSRNIYRQLCDEGFLKISDYTILQRKIDELVERISVGDQMGYQQRSVA